jgi:mono/diheme cytochrome c family protein
MRRTIKYLVCAGFFAATGMAAQQEFSRVTAQSAIDFKRDIEPIFAQHCVQCHGPKKAAGQLRLDTQSLAMKGGISGAAIIPRAGRDSLLIKRIRGESGQARMPMGAEALPAKQIELIQTWIDQGAAWQAGPGIRGPESGVAVHWSYVKPVRPELPAVKNNAWVRNPVDAFILARLEKEGLAPSQEADKAALLRRVYLDLIGIPPSVKEVDEFMADASPDAYEKLVDRLLASPHYGERWARLWLDLARYADSNGYEKDNLRTAWKFRDWVIDAFNKDMPFDRFTIEQLAGDMLLSPTIEQKLATGFHRNTMVNQEGGIDPEEARFETLVDRVNTTSTVWLGSTLACAQCHNHKYDPFSQKDYYRMMAFFDNAEYLVAYQTPGADESRYILEPQIDLPTPEQAENRTTLDAEIKQIETKLKTQTPELDAEQNLWERALLDEEKKWTVLDPIKFESAGGATLKILDDKSILASGAKPEIETYAVTAKTDLKNIAALRIEAMPDASLPKGGPGRDPYGNFLLTGIEIVAAPANGGAGQIISLKEVAVDNAAYRIEQKQFLGKEPAAVATDRPTGWFVNATSDEVRLPRQGVFLADVPFGFDAGTQLTIRLKHTAGSLNQAFGRFRLSISSANEAKKIVSISAQLRPALAKAHSARSQKERDDLSAAFRQQTPLLKPDRDRLERLRDSLKELNIVTTLVMRERQGYDRPSTYFRERGSFLNPAGRIYAATPAVLPPMPEDAPINRLGLARWLVDENNPLTARVMVNRYWEAVFGRGIVETSEDFGSQGERPWHPELLDWLAVEFMKGPPNQPPSTDRRPWSTKHLLRLLVTSSTYRQSSATTPALLEKDPYNRLLARGTRFRMEAEMIRDATLTASGLLSRKVGGPSVFPLQPEGIWKAPYSGEKWMTSKGEDRFRRSLYTFVRRSSPHPAMMTFDATSREYCTVRRVRTNTPLQALTMLNDEAAMTAARAMAKVMLAQGSSPEQCIRYGFRACVTRKPKETETARLLALYQQQVEYFNAHPAEAVQVTREPNSPEFAAWTMVANVLLNLDETLTKQ